MSNRVLVVLVALLLAAGALLGALWGLLTLADAMDRIEQELGS